MAISGDDFARHFFRGEINRMTGTGGELLVKGPDNRGRGRDSRIEVGDRLIGIGITHFIESMERPPGPDNVRHALSESPKAAARAFATVSKREVAGGYAFRFEPLPPADYCALLDELSGGASPITPETVPEGTMILSFLMDSPGYTLARGLSPADNWRPVLNGKRHWNVGFGDPADFWAAEFPSDDIGLLQGVDPWIRLGRISFGLSLLSGGGDVRLDKVPAQHPDGADTRHDFHLLGHVVGTRGLDTPFGIGLRTEIIFKPTD